MIFIDTEKSIYDDWNTVFTVNDYWDGPLYGVADFNGKPHVYRRIFSEDLDEWTFNYYLKPISERDFILVMEDWNIWLRWNKKFYFGEVNLESHPYLLEDKVRYDELKFQIEVILKVSSECNLIASGKFRSINVTSEEKWLLENPCLKPRQVNWTIIGNQ